MTRKVPNKPADAIVIALKPFKKVFVGMAVFTAVMNLLMLVPSFYMLEVYDRVLSSRNEFTLLVLTLLMLGLYVAYSCLEGVRGLATIKLGEAIEQALNQEVFTATFDAALRTPGFNAQQPLNDLTTVRQFLTSAPLFAFFDAPWFPVYLVVVYAFSFWMGLFATVSVLVLVVLAVINEVLTKKHLEIANKKSILSLSTASNTIKNAEVLEAMGMLPAMQKRWLQVHNEFLGSQSLASVNGLSIGSMSRFVRLTMQSMILGLGAYLVLKNELTAGMMIASSILLGRTLAPAEQVIGSWKQFKGAISAYDRLKEVLAESRVQRSSMSLPRPKGFLSVENLFAAAPGMQRPVLQGVAFQVDPGDVLGVIGPSASGKSTLARAIVGVWPVLGGAVRIDGADVHSWNKAELGPAVGYVPQDVEIFQGTIAENIARFGDVNPDKVVGAATQAGIHEMVLRFPDGYNTLVGPGGAGLSGGQMQRVALARALYDDPIYIVLDEPNSNLDEHGELALVKALMHAKQRKATTVVITHRTSVLQATTKLLVMAEGRIVMFGSTKEVMENLQKNQQAAQKALAEASPAIKKSPQDAGSTEGGSVA